MRRSFGLILIICGCAGPPPDPLTALIDATPTSVCRGDANATVIELSGARSAALLSLVAAPPDPGAPPLEYTWRLEGAEHTIVAGSALEAALWVTTVGDRPLHVSLTVVNGEGGEATSTTSIGVDPCEP